MNEQNGTLLSKEENMSISGLTFDRSNYIARAEAVEGEAITMSYGMNSTSITTTTTEPEEGEAVTPTPPGDSSSTTTTTEPEEGEAVTPTPPGDSSSTTTTTEPEEGEAVTPTPPGDSSSTTTTTEPEEGEAVTPTPPDDSSSTTTTDTSNEGNDDPVVNGTEVKVMTGDGTSLLVYESSSETSTCVGSFADGSIVTLTSGVSPNNGWYAVHGTTVDGVSINGWCHGNYLAQSVEYGTLVDVALLHVRSDTSTTSEALGTIERGESVQILHKNYRSANNYHWHQIWYNDSIGYVVAGNETPNFEFETRWVCINDEDNDMPNDDPTNTNLSESQIQTILNNIQNCSTKIVSTSKKSTFIAIANAMLKSNYELSFIAGMLGNIKSEGICGQFENSNYTDYNKKPDYLRYMDEKYNGADFYKNNYSDKNITGVNVIVVHNILLDLERESKGTWKIGDSRVGFGLGCLQWSFARTMTLVKNYLCFNNNSDKITLRKVEEAEAATLITELQSSSYRGIYMGWKENYTNYDHVDCASAAAEMLCLRYIKPYKKEEQAIIRKRQAEEIYQEMVKNVF